MSHVYTSALNFNSHLNTAGTACYSYWTCALWESGGNTAGLNVGIQQGSSTEGYSIILPIAELGTNVGRDSYGLMLVYDPTPIPEPSTMLLMGSGLLLMGGYVWRRERFKQV